MVVLFCEITMPFRFQCTQPLEIQGSVDSLENGGNLEQVGMAICSLRLEVAMRCRAIVLVFLAVHGVAAGSAIAQAPTVERSGGALAKCTYDRCALRLDRKVFSFLGNETLRVGMDGAEMRIGFSGDVVTAMVAGVPDAVRHAEQGSRARERGGLASALGFLVVAAALSQVGAPESNGSYISARSLALAGAGAAVAIYGGVQVTRGSQAFSRAVWLYNRALPR